MRTILLRGWRFCTLTASIVAVCTVSVWAQAPTPTGADDKSKMSTTVKSCENFFEHANGAWLQKAQIPSDRGGWGAFAELDERNIANLRTILDETGKQVKTTKSETMRKVGYFYLAAMDTNRIEREGLKPLRRE